MRAVVAIWTADEMSFGEPFEGHGCLDKAHTFANDLRDRDDFPGALIGVLADPEAAEDRQARIMASLRSPR